ncbi:MAG: hypothetical protein HRU19_30595 [Pseudobacteriovorax sp.]|nr:hypothetical protein [Pseudobacteriovorax sp.]
MIKSIITLSLLCSSMTALATEYKDDENVSTMKGRLVEVGERNRYHYNAPKFNLDVNPFGLVAGTYSVGASYALGDIATVRGDVSYSEYTSSMEYSISSQLYFKKMYSGIYLEPGVLRREIGNVLGPQVLLGYTWFWDSGLNISLAVGGGRNLNDSEDDDFYEDDDETIDSFSNGYLRVGYAF